MKKTNVLIFPSGAENAINIYDSLKYNLHFELFGASSKMDHSDYIYDDDHLSYGDYNIHDDDFFENINSLIDKFKIDYIFPTHDEISTFLIKYQNKINAVVVCSPYETCEVALSKLKTAEILKNKWYYPKIYNVNDEIDYPVFIKPDVGAGAKNTHVVNNENELKNYCDTNNYLIAELLPGEEITVDCFTNKDRNLLFVGPRTRERITNGIAFRSSNLPVSDDILKIARDLNSVFNFRGLWFFQLKKDKKGEYKLLEFSIRCAGTMALYRQLGINFAALSLFDFMGFDLKIIKNDFNIKLDRFYKSCYKVDIEYQNIYLDFDDTLIVNGKVNLTIIQLLYQWKEQNKSIYLLTKHSTNIYDDLREYRIDIQLFDEIIVIPDAESKYKYINNNDSIFIDNYFPERMAVFEEKNIPVFDVDAAECLIKTIGV
ncbi:MAG: ATP-grasp domain-containing protein [Bacilli bacterium]|nr:ATP-grasp domain-containing protein [Bacilli bacterium]